MPLFVQFLIVVVTSSPFMTLPKMPPTFFTPLIEPLLVHPSMSTAKLAQLTMPAVYCFDLAVPLVSSALPLLVQFFTAPEYEPAMPAEPRPLLVERLPLLVQPSIR